MAKKQQQMNVDYNVYNGSNKMLGVARVTMPTLSWIVATMSGAGIAGNVEAVARGMMEAMTLGLDFRMVGEDAYQLTSPERHVLTLRNAEQYEDPILGQVRVDGVKHVFAVMPKTLNPGTVAQASTHDGSGQYAVRSWQMYHEGTCYLDIDQLNGKCVINGKDYRADINAVI